MINFKTNKGFSLVEMIISFIIVAILLTLAVPKVREIMAKSLEVEAKEGLASLYRKQQLYYFQHHRYSDSMDLIKFQHEGENYMVGFGGKIKVNRRDNFKASGPLSDTENESHDAWIEIWGKNSGISQNCLVNNNNRGTPTFIAATSNILNGDKNEGYNYKINEKNKLLRIDTKTPSKETTCN